MTLLKSSLNSQTPRCMITVITFKLLIIFLEPLIQLVNIRVILQVEEHPDATGSSGGVDEAQVSCPFCSKVFAKSSQQLRHIRYLNSKLKIPQHRQVFLIMQYHQKK